MSMDQGPITSTSTAGPRPRSRGISFGSIGSGGSKDIDSPKEKAKRDGLWQGLSKANPNAAITEAQPGVASVLEQTTIQNLREMRHKDAFGNDIADPDLSNPTRPRMERPLDTIRNFERAIDNGYKRRSTFKDDSDRSNDFASKRSSYFGGEYAPSNRRQSNANRAAGYGNGANHNGQSNGAGGGYYGSQGGYYGNGNSRVPPRQRYGDRMQSDPHLYGAQKPYAQHGYHQSHDTVNTGITNGSDSTGPWANSTDPSSENSSLDRVTANKPQTPMDPYGQQAANGYNGPIMEEQAYGDIQFDDISGGQNGYYQQNGYPHADGRPSQPPQISSPREIYARHNSAPMPPVHAQQNMHAQQNGGVRKPMNLNAPPASASANYAGGNLPMPSTRREPEKRKSWLARRFSKKE